MEYRTAGNSVIAFGTVLLLGSLLSALFFGSCGIDLVAILIVPLGISVADGSRRAAKWSIGIMALYFLVTLFMIWAVTFRSERLRLGNRDMSPDAIPWALGFIAIFAVWSLANILWYANCISTHQKGATHQELAKALLWKTRQEKAVLSSLL